jgi:hypothetical protein
MYDPKHSQDVVLTTGPFSVFVNSFLALLNARHYLQPTAEANKSSEVHKRQGIYRPELHVMASQEEELHGSRKNMFKHPGDDVMHLTRSAMVSSCISTGDERVLIVTL